MEAPMKTFYFAASLLMASTAAHAGNGISFQIDGRKVHIEAPRNCSSLDCIQVTGTGLNLKNLKSKIAADDDQVATTSSAPAPKAAPAPAAPQAPAPAPIASTTPTVADASPGPQLHDVTPSNSNSAPPPAPVTAAATPAPTAAAAPPAAAGDTPASPLGLWATQDNKGNVQIEPCGQNLCGYAEKSREAILINMKPQNNKWTGRIHDPDGGSNYDSTIVLKGPNILKVQGCAFGGLFCGGQTWKRIS
jgi:uncharacterized protein (DUF2147 family)